MYSNIISRITKPASLLLFYIILFALFYFSTFNDLFRTWVTGSGAYSHGLLLFVVCCYLFYKAWALNKISLALSFSFSGMVILAGASLIWAVSRLLLIDTFQLLIIPFILFSILVSLLGWKQSRIFVFPVALLLLAMPLFDWLMPALQDITATMTGTLLTLAGISSIVEGVLILVPAGTFEVDRGCSGLNVFSVGLILSLLYAYMNYFSIWQGMLLALLGVAVSILSNIIRVFIIAVVGNASQMQHPLVAEHANLGWFVFMITYGIFYFLVHKYWPVQGQIKADGMQQNELEEGRTIYRPNQILIRSMLVAAGIGFGPLLIYGYTGTEQLRFDTARIVPSKLGAWESMSTPVETWQTRFSGGEGDFLRSNTYINNGHRKVYLVLRHYSKQAIGNEAVNSTNEVFDRQAWTRVWKKSFSSKQPNATSLSVDETLVRGARNNEVLIWRWYLTFGKVTSSPIKAKIYNLFGIMTGKPEIFVFVIASEVSQSYDDSRRILEDFYMGVNRSYGVNQLLSQEYKNDVR